MTGSFSAMSSGGPSSPENSTSRSEMSASILSTERLVGLPALLSGPFHKFFMSFNEFRF